MSGGAFYRPPGPLAARSSRRSRSLRRAFLLLGASALTAGTATGALLLLRLHPRFEVTRVVLEGVPEARRAEAEAVTDPWIGRPLLFVDLDAGVATLKAQPWVERASARRIVPDTVVVAVSARPAVALALRDGALSAVDASGSTLGAFTPRAGSADDFVVLDPSPCGDDPKALPRGAAFVARLKQDDPALFARLSEVEVLPHGVAVVDRVARVRLLFGADAAEPGRASASWRAFLALAPELDRHSLSRTEADLRFADRIILNALPPEAERGKT